MSRTDIDPATLAKALRQMAGDGSIEWVMQPIQASVLLDVADALDENEQLRDAAERDADVMESLSLSLEDEQTENAKLRERVDELEGLTDGKQYIPQEWYQLAMTENAKLRNLVTEMHSFITSLPSSVRDYDNPLGNWEYTMQELGIEVES